MTGVVNFVMDTDFEGFRLDGQYSFYNHSNRAGSDVRDALGARGFGAPRGQVADGGTIDVTAAFGTASMMAAATSPPMLATARSTR